MGWAGLRKTCRLQVLLDICCWLSRISTSLTRLRLSWPTWQNNLDKRDNEFHVTFECLCNRTVSVVDCRMSVYVPTLSTLSGSKAESGECYGITYDVCRECRGVGQTTLVPCTAYSDAVCGCEVGYISNSTDICQKQLAVTVPPNLPGSTPYNWENGQEDNVPTEIIILLVILPVILLIMGGVLICLHRWISSQEFCKKVPRWGEQNV
ncbi:uncharacterized protein LOC124470905 isoform X1 [Hypomesus transpacificus]|uniref:uncharacterized protein LOC124470905 isoform X1 n=1 Tax=Hypomesus transpacificus TaxID=137520 RepID=UPI001F08413A|nr:uncharacterized protein LOC124470905 isoform X1 [Hypomesus transpacificus]